MTTSMLYAFVGAALFSAGLFGMITAHRLIRTVMAFNIAGSGVFLFLVAMAYRDRAAFPDPVPHAMVLTGIVVAVSATALALLLICRLQECSGSSSTDPDGRP